jgi:hypothetical protein
MLLAVMFFDKTADINSVILHRALWEDALYEEHSLVVVLEYDASYEWYKAAWFVTF